MELKPFIANSLWLGSNVPAYRRFRNALGAPRDTQRRKLRELLGANRDTAFGKAHGFDAIHNYEEFTHRVPLSDYRAFEPWVTRIRQGERNVLTCDPVTHLIPTSGSTGARKLIPFTAGLQREFNAALGPWLVDVARQFPGVLGGPAYWSITPALGEGTTEDSVVPISFDTDTAYLGASRRRLAEAVMAVPASACRAESIEVFRRRTLLHLLLCRELRLTSVWHPAFLTLLLDFLPVHWESLLADVEAGTSVTKPMPSRARELHAADPLRPETIWPELRVISCWGNGAAALQLDDLRRRFPNIRLQPKGLLATEAFVTLPFDGQYPLAVGSHFFEFIDQAGQTLVVEALREHEEYEVVVTTAGGLWRYRLGDRVCVTGCVENTPSLEFLGRNESVSDRFGEKLCEPFVAEALRDVFGTEIPRFAVIAPDEDECGFRYTLYVEGEVKSHWAAALDHALRQNPHYAYCRDLGQLLPARIFVIAERGFERFASRQAANGARLGDVKPTALSRTADWSKFFKGTYAEQWRDAAAQDRVTGGQTAEMTGH